MFVVLYECMCVCMCVELCQDESEGEGRGAWERGAGGGYVDEDGGEARGTPKGSQVPNKKIKKSQVPTNNQRQG